MSDRCETAARTNVCNVQSQTRICVSIGNPARVLQVGPMRCYISEQVKSKTRSMPTQSPPNTASSWEPSATTWHVIRWPIGTYSYSRQTPLAFWRHTCETVGPDESALHRRIQSPLNVGRHFDGISVVDFISGVTKSRVGLVTRNPGLVCVFWVDAAST